MNLPLLKDLVKKDNYVRFVKYFDGNLWYITYAQNLAGKIINPFEFPVPISDIGNATFLAEEKSTMMMRYIRKHLEMLKKAEAEMMEVTQPNVVWEPPHDRVSVHVFEKPAPLTWAQRNAWDTGGSDSDE